MTKDHVMDERWIRRFHKGPPDRARLVCFPHAGGPASAFFPLSRIMAQHAEVLAVQYPGRQDRRAERPIESIPSLADRIADAVEPRSDRPLALFGHSMGALVAFEVASRLGQTVSVLFVSGRRPPSRSLPETVHLLSDREMLDNIRVLGGTDARLFSDDELVRLALPALRADYRALGAYAPDPAARVDVAISVLVGDADLLTPVDDARCWARHTTGTCETTVFPGGHFYINEQTAEVAEAIATRLGRDGPSRDVASGTSPEAVSALDHPQVRGQREDGLQIVPE